MYSTNKKPAGLSTLNSLATNDTVIVGDTSDTEEVVKVITFSDLLTQLQSLISGGGGSVTVTEPAGTINGANVTFTSAVVALWIDTDTGRYYPNKGYTRSGTTYTMDLAPNDYIYLVS
jgi:hypothetical protein